MMKKYPRTYPLLVSVISILKNKFTFFRVCHSSQSFYFKRTDNDTMFLYSFFSQFMAKTIANALFEGKEEGEENE